MYIHWFSLTVDFNIQDFLAYYWKSFPEASITPKMHMLEDHTIPWLEQWQCGLGFHGEQGLESGHAEFNSLKVTYQNIRDQAEKRRHLLKEHHLKKNPDAASYIPPIKKRKQQIFNETVLQF